eukprot:INCI5912.2.p1 GENE.INCI5912.2~~INCI5912.2.p1  ORF type:complete len:1134 (-),score=164.42 INCI5912.2:851-4252(-)
MSYRKGNRSKLMLARGSKGLSGRVKARRSGAASASTSTSASSSRSAHTPSASRGVSAADAPTDRAAYFYNQSQNMNLSSGGTGVASNRLRFGGDPGGRGAGSLVTQGTGLSGYHPKTGLVRGNGEVHAAAAAAAATTSSIKDLLLRRSGGSRGLSPRQAPAQQHRRLQGKPSSIASQSSSSRATSASAPAAQRPRSGSRNSFVQRTRNAAANSRRMQERFQNPQLLHQQQQPHTSAPSFQTVHQRDVTRALISPRHASSASSASREGRGNFILPVASRRAKASSAPEDRLNANISQHRQGLEKSSSSRQASFLSRQSSDLVDNDSDQDHVSSLRSATSGASLSRPSSAMQRTGPSGVGLLRNTRESSFAPETILRPRTSTGQSGRGFAGSQSDFRRGRGQGSDRSFGIGAPQNHQREIEPGVHLIQNFKDAMRIVREPNVRSLNPERIVLENMDFKTCPLIEGEDDSIRLVNLKNNSIADISNLDALTKLIFLDLYNNQITKLCNLEQLQMLRVLMLGKNRIKRLEGLAQLKSLDVLDLHSNEITQIENINHMQFLRILNLSGNRIRVVENLEGLTSLIELNLCRNQVEIVQGLGQLKSLKRLFLSTNKISSFHDIRSLLQVPSLEELTLFKNHISSFVSYRSRIVLNCQRLKVLDGSEIRASERNAEAYLANSRLNLKDGFEAAGIELDASKHSPPKHRVDRESFAHTRHGDTESAGTDSNAEDGTGHLQEDNSQPDHSHRNSRHRRRPSRNGRHRHRHGRSGRHGRHQKQQSEPENPIDAAQRRSIILSAIKKSWEHHEQGVLAAAQAAAGHPRTHHERETALDTEIGYFDDSDPPSLLEVKQVHRNGVESSAEEPWLYVYGEGQLSDISPKKYANIVGVHFQFTRFDRILRDAMPRIAALGKIEAVSFESTALSSLQQLETLFFKLRKTEQSHSTIRSGLSSRIRAFSAKNGNSVAKLALYRPLLLNLFPSLSVIDGVSVTQLERRSCSNMFRPAVTYLRPLFERNFGALRLSNRLCKELEQSSEGVDAMYWNATLHDTLSSKRSLSAAFLHGKLPVERGRPSALRAQRSHASEVELRAQQDVANILGFAADAADAMMAVNGQWDDFMLREITREVAAVKAARKAWTNPD